MIKKVIAVIAVFASFNASADKLSNYPEAFCAVAELSSKMVMDRLNRGEPVQSLYSDVSKIKNYELRQYIGAAVSIANQFPRDTSPKTFAEWVKGQCLQDLNAGAQFAPHGKQ